ncbi:hypothetical protein KO02_02865 [Sphingobacterium sp. ML3W]|uniref:lysylphosphatidylglycerol synthase transmembrane domain-containing protein n=1 Tax=Sphingobacterium sp. ML3W TaxID=1538644 RepID=UPI0004F8367A|nr:lysylphosphatidylglycerol synthase domain-containing protein [Sphingobacterium sp. ML3W]AIM35738.1 hypothetical protein KO02_02865 [Sphingobacterium sp. ML3W]
MLKRILKITISLIILLSLAVFISHIDLKAVFKEVAHMGWKLLWIIVITGLAYLLGTAGWQNCFIEKPKQTSLWQLFCIRHIGETVGLFNPTSIIGGDYIKTVLLKPTGTSEQEIVNSVLISRFLAIITQFSLFGLSGLWFLLGSFTKNIPEQMLTMLWILVMLLFSLPLITFCILKRSKKFQVTSTLSWSFFRKLSIRFQTILNAVLAFHQGHPYQCYRAYFYFFLHWMVGALELFLILYFSGITIPIILSQFMDMSIVIIKSFGAFIPAQIGIEEFGNKLLLTSAGIYTVQIWLTIALIRRSRQVFWITFGFLAYIGLKKRPYLLSYGNSLRQP